MKRSVTYWQAAVLFLVFTLVIAVYFFLGWLWSRTHAGRQGAAADRTPASKAPVQITDPLDGAVLQRSVEVTVGSALLEPGFLEAEFVVDGRLVATKVNPQPQTVPWTVQWLWDSADEGTHTLALRARRANGEVETSPLVSVVVVPIGRLVFVSNRDGVYAIYSMRTDGRQIERLTSGPGDARQPAVGKDGQLAYVTKTGNGQSTIRRMAQGNSTGENWLAGAEPAWAPDGLVLAYSSIVGGVSQISVVAASGGPPSQVTDEEIYAGQPAWSPDGTRLAYVAERDGNLDIWVLFVDGSGAYRLTDSPAKDWAPAWSPDGSQLAFVSDRGGSHQIYAMQADGSRPRLLSDSPLGAEGPVWSPDGFWLAFVAYTGEASGIRGREIHLMRSDGQSQVRLTFNDADDTEIEWPVLAE
jgi:dipeptidyl aminopeptidase/acylaminoacyl peptidase